jgi:hypothetical protein
VYPLDKRVPSTTPPGLSTFGVPLFISEASRVWENFPGILEGNFFNYGSKVELSLHIKNYKRRKAT